MSVNDDELFGLFGGDKKDKPSPATPKSPTSPTSHPTGAAKIVTHEIIDVVIPDKPDGPKTDGPKTPDHGNHDAADHKDAIIEDLCVRKINIPEGMSYLSLKLHSMLMLKKTFLC